MSLFDNRVVNLNLTSSSPLLPSTVAISNMFNQIAIERQSIFFLELRFSYKFKNWLRNLNGDWTLIESYPIAPSSSYLFKIHPESLTSYNYFLDGLLSDLNFNASVRSILANKIASFLVSLANKQSFPGFCAVAEVETANQKWLDADEIQNVITATAAAAARLGGDLVVPPCRVASIYGAEGCSSDKVSGDCVICLEELSGAVKDVIRLPCDHLFHEKCIFKWLNDQNSCPLCRCEA